MHSTIISVVIPTHNRCNILLRNLSALSLQAQANPVIEVLVVADTCLDDTEEKVLQFAKSASFPIRLFNHSAQSASVGRNLGAKHAKGKILLFLDDDLIPQPGFINAHLSAQLEGRVVLGYSKPVYSMPLSFWQMNARLWWEDMYSQMRQPGHRFSYRDFFSGNLSMFSDLFRRIGGFDDQINGRLEDYEAGMRLIEAGARFFFAQEALAYHFDETDLTLWLHRSYLEGKADVQIVRRHPMLRAERFAKTEHSELRSKVRQIVRLFGIAESRVSNWAASRLLDLAKLSEKMKIRKIWWLAIGVLREYHYWRGVASELGGRQATKDWVINSPEAFKVSDTSPVIDLAEPIDRTKRQIATYKAEQEGLKIKWKGLDLFELPFEPGKEPLRDEHLWAFLQNKAAEEFLPALAIDLIQSSESKRTIWQSNLLK